MVRRNTAWSSSQQVLKVLGDSHGRLIKTLTVLEWFAEAGMALRPAMVRVPERPIGAVWNTLFWALEGSVSQRLLEFARSAAGSSEEGQAARY